MAALAPAVLRAALPQLAHKGELVLAVRATRDPARDLGEPYALQWGAERQEAIEGVVCAYATRPVVDARGRQPALLLTDEELDEELEEARERLQRYFARRGGMADELRVVIYVARRSDRAGHDDEELVTPLLLLCEEARS